MNHAKLYGLMKCAMETEMWRNTPGWRRKPDKVPGLEILHDHPLTTQSF